MPPKAKFTREQITEAGLNIIRESGMEDLTARTLGKRLGSSSCPIFTVFDNMEEVQTAVKQAAKALYSEYVKEGLKETPAFKGVGMQYVSFAINEPKLFQLLFMSEQKQKPDSESILTAIEDNYDKILDSVRYSYGLEVKDAEILYRHLWIYTHGIAVLLATGMCRFNIEEIGIMLSEIFVPLLKEIKGGNAK